MNQPLAVLQGPARLAPSHPQLFTLISRLARLALAVICLLAPEPAFADLITVAPSGSGADFTTVNHALFNAGPDGTIYVLPGEYKEEISVIARSANIVGAATDMMTLRLNSAFRITRPAIKIQSLSADQAVNVLGMTVITKDIPHAGSGATSVFLSEGPVTFSGSLAPLVGAW